ncbi:class I SAM-dependent methyltransferase [Kiloniella sp. b19]|uniref:class I SAM-dependent methyltransferase n=1 Tax=Kiloniella sp. GXU_MW_B19 TaxID=3141326 RepID=UPI0031D6E280
MSVDAIMGCQALSEKSDKLPAQITFMDKLKAWWNGYEIHVKTRSVGAKDKSDEKLPVSDEEQENARIQLLQELWGEGYSSPGEQEYILELIKPFGLDPAMNVADIGAGLGGSSRLMADKFGVWVNAFERETAMVEKGMELSTKAGLAKKAPIKGFSPEKQVFDERSFNCIFSKEILYTYKDRTRLITDLCKALKSEGQFLFTDFVLQEPKNPKDTENERAAFDWNENEFHDCDLWKVGDYTETMTENGLDVRISEDISPKYIDMVEGRWREFTLGLQGKKIPDHLADAIVVEAEMWTERVRLLKEGRIRLYRFLGMRPSNSKLMSDW